MSEPEPANMPAPDVPATPARAKRRSRATGRRPGRRTLGEIAAQKVEAAMAKFRGGLPDALARIIELACDPKTSPAVVVQLALAVDRLTPMLPSVGQGLEDLDVVTYLRLIERYRAEFPNEAALRREVDRLTVERDSARESNAPLLAQFRAAESENVTLRTAIHRLTKRSPYEVLRELAIPARDPDSIASAHVDIFDPGPAPTIATIDPVGDAPAPVNDDGAAACVVDGETSGLGSTGAESTSVSVPTTPAGPLERARAALERGERPPESDLQACTRREIDALERKYSRTLQWSSSDPDAPWNLNRRAKAGDF